MEILKNIELKFSWDNLTIKMPTFDLRNNFMRKNQINHGILNKSKIKGKTENKPEWLSPKHFLKVWHFIFPFGALVFWLERAMASEQRIERKRG